MSLPSLLPPLFPHSTLPSTSCQHSSLSSPLHSFYAAFPFRALNFAYSDSFSVTAIILNLLRVKLNLSQHLLLLNAGYIRLCKISKDLGRLADASLWINLALQVDPGHLEATVVSGELFAETRQWEKAKKTFEKLCAQVFRRSVHFPRHILPYNRRPFLLY